MAKNNKQNEQDNESGINRTFTLIGTIVLIAMFTVVSFNFIRDARIFQKSRLSSITNSDQNGTGNSRSDYGTLKYKKDNSKASTKDTNDNDTTQNISSQTSQPDGSTSMPAGNP